MELVLAEAGSIRESHDYESYDASLTAGRRQHSNSFPFFIDSGSHVQHSYVPVSEMFPRTSGMERESRELFPCGGHAAVTSNEQR